MKMFAIFVEVVIGGGEIKSGYADVAIRTRVLALWLYLRPEGSFLPPPPLIRRSSGNPIARAAPAARMHNNAFNGY